jgi:hypothetical protein
MTKRLREVDLATLTWSLFLAQNLGHLLECQISKIQKEIARGKEKENGGVWEEKKKQIRNHA